MQQQDQPSPFGLDEARAFIARATWVFARTVPEWPHWYAVRRDCARIGLAADFAAFQASIETAGYDRWWGWRTWRTLDVDDFIYWLDGKDNLINRARRDTPAPVVLEPAQLRLEVD
jgi:hypothetical protein